MSDRRLSAPQGASLLNPRTLARAAALVYKHGNQAMQLGQSARRKVDQAAKWARKEKNPQISQRMSSRKTTAPANQGTISRSLTSPKFSVPFSAPILQIYSGANGIPVYGAIPVPTTALGGATVAISPYLGASTQYFPAAFPGTISRIAQCFQRYRIRPGSGKMSFRTAVPTSMAGSLALSVTPGDEPSTSIVTYQSVATAECAIITPVWAANVPFDRSRLNSVLKDDEWKYCDFDNTVQQAETRQAVICSLSVSGLGLPASTVYGYLFFEGVFEFQHLQDVNTSIGAAGPVLPPPHTREPSFEMEMEYKESSARPAVAPYRPASSPRS